MNARLFLLEPGKLGVKVFEGGQARRIEMGFATPEGLEDLLAALPLQSGDRVAVRRESGGFWQDALEGLIIRRHPGVLPLTHELAPGEAPAPPADPAPGADVYYYIDEVLGDAACALAVGKGAAPGARAFPLPEGWHALRLVAARPGGAPWLFDVKKGCSRPGLKELARSTLCMMLRPMGLPGPADFLVELAPGGEIEVTLRAWREGEARPIARQTVPPVRARGCAI